MGDYQADAAMLQFDISVERARANEAITILTNEYRRPSVLFRPKLSIDGNQWCALYGENLQDGVAGFGDSPEKAMADFDRAWLESLKSKEVVQQSPARDPSWPAKYDPKVHDGFWNRKSQSPGCWEIRGGLAWGFRADGRKDESAFSLEQLINQITDGDLVRNTWPIPGCEDGGK